jgi:hypothetical protein
MDSVQNNSHIYCLNCICAHLSGEMVSIIKQCYHCKFLFLNRNQIQEYLDCMYPEEGGIWLVRNVVNLYQSTRGHIPKTWNIKSAPVFK